MQNLALHHFALFVITFYSQILLLPWLQHCFSTKIKFCIKTRNGHTTTTAPCFSVSVNQTKSPVIKITQISDTHVFFFTWMRSLACSQIGRSHQKVHLRYMVFFLQIYCGCKQELAFLKPTDFYNFRQSIGHPDPQGRQDIKKAKVHDAIQLCV